MLCPHLSLSRYEWDHPFPQIKPSILRLRRARIERNLAKRRTRRGLTFRRYGSGPVQLIRAAPQVNPDPKATITVLSPGFRRSCSRASTVAIGIDAVEVFP